MNSAFEILDEVERETQRLRGRAIVGDMWRVVAAELATSLSEVQVRDVLSRVERSIRHEIATTDKIKSEDARAGGEELTNDFVASVNEFLRTLYKL